MNRSAGLNAHGATSTTAGSPPIKTQPVTFETTFAAASSEIVTVEPTLAGLLSSATSTHVPFAIGVLRPDTVPMLGAPTATRVTSKLPPMFPVLQILTLPTSGVLLVTAPPATTKLHF